MDGWILRVLSHLEALFRNKRVVFHFWVGSFGNEVNTTTAEQTDRTKIS